MLTYGAESLILNKGIAKWLATYKREVLKIIFGGMKVNEIGKNDIIN